MGIVFIMILTILSISITLLGVTLALLVVYYAGKYAGVFDALKPHNRAKLFQIFYLTQGVACGSIIIVMLSIMAWLVCFN